MASFVVVFVLQGFTLLHFLYSDPKNAGAQTAVQLISFVVTMFTYVMLLLVVVHFATEGTRFYFLTRVCKCLPDRWRAPKYRINDRERPPNARMDGDAFQRVR